MLCIYTCHMPQGMNDALGFWQIKVNKWMKIGKDKKNGQFTELIREVMPHSKTSKQKCSNILKPH